MESMVENPMILTNEKWLCRCGATGIRIVMDAQMFDPDVPSVISAVDVFCLSCNVLVAHGVKAVPLHRLYYSQLKYKE